MATAITYRAMKDDDADEVNALCIGIFDEFIAASCNAEGRMDFVDDTSPAKLRERTISNYIILALDNDTIVGVADMRRDGYLRLLFVERRYQNGGIGRTLLNRCIEKSIADGRRLSKIEVKSAIDAVSYYEKLGFKKDDDIQEHKGIRYIPMSLEL